MSSAARSKGDTADGGWSEVMPEFQAKFGGLKVILPNAPISAVTLNGGMKMPSWHDIKSLANIDKEDFNGLEESRTTIENILNEEIKSSGLSSKKIILGGFSQGAALAMFTGLQYSQPLGGILALSGYLPYSKNDFASKINSANKATPLAMFHGEADQVVGFDKGQRSFKAIQEARGEEGKEEMKFSSYKGVGHHSSEQEMRDVAAWMAKILA